MQKKYPGGNWYLIAPNPIFLGKFQIEQARLSKFGVQVISPWGGGGGSSQPTQTKSAVASCRSQGKIPPPRRLE
jgi:hypothetical protein